VKAVFLDRDGVINKKIANGYVLDWQDFEFLPGIVEAIKLLNQQDVPVIIITNQSAVNRGLLSAEKLQQIHSLMLSCLDSQGAQIKDVFVCPHRPDENCNCRKPKTGLFDKVKNKYDIDLEQSWFIGDSDSDIEAGKKIGCKTYLLKKSEMLTPVIEKILENWK